MAVDLQGAERASSASDPLAAPPPSPQRHPPHRLRSLGLAATSAALAIAITGFAFSEIARESRRAEIAQLAGAYEQRLAALTRERDAAAEALRLAQDRFAEAMERIGQGEAELTRLAETARTQDLTLGAVRRKLADAVRLRDIAMRENRALASELAAIKGELTRSTGTESELSEALGSISLALAETVARREAAEAEIASLSRNLSSLEGRMRLDSQRMERLLGRLEEAVTVGLGNLGDRLAPTGLDLERLLSETRASYSGEGGPFLAATAAAFQPEDPAAPRIDRLMEGLERLQLLRIAAARLPLALPVQSAFRLTSGFGNRAASPHLRARFHEGIDLAAPRGTPIHATAEGEVVFAGRMSGYGNLVKIRHAFGLETVYAHLSAIRVKQGAHVAQGDRIGDMGNTGRSTGTHLHYEVRINGTPVNPMSYMKAARDVL